MNVLCAAVSTVFSGLASTLENWINNMAAFVQNPFGLTWVAIVIGVGVLIVVLMWRKAT